MDERSKKVLSRLEALCSREEKCSADVLGKAIEKLDGDESAAAEVLDSLLKDDFVDDSRFARAFARDKSIIAGWGPAKIRQALSVKRIPGSLIDEALSSINPDDSKDKLVRVLKSKWRSLRCPDASDPAYYGARIKLIKFGLSRGYDYESVSKAFSELDR